MDSRGKHGWMMGRGGLKRNGGSEIGEGGHRTKINVAGCGPIWVVMVMGKSYNVQRHFQEYVV